MNESIVDRTNLIENWLKNQLDISFKVEPASSDASFRRYFRISTSNETYILMDAPPEKEPIKSFIEISKMLQFVDLKAPNILFFSEDLGFILMSDLGKNTYLDKFNDENLADLYGYARDTIIQMQKSIDTRKITNYSDQLMIQEMCLFNEWYISKYKGLKLDSEEKYTVNNIFKSIIIDVNSQPKYFVHRDYHSRNLMFLPGDNMPGILDFQDAVHGPLSYDLVSLLKDAYHELDEEFILDQSARYWEQAKKNNLIGNSDFSDFYKSFEWMGVQRHLKVLGVFARLSIRDKKNQYLDNIPLVEKYLMKTTERYKKLHPLRRILDKVIS